MASDLQVKPSDEGGILSAVSVCVKSGWDVPQLLGFDCTLLLCV